MKLKSQKNNCVLSKIQKVKINQWQQRLCAAFGALQLKTQELNVNYLNQRICKKTKEMIQQFFIQPNPVR